MNKKIVFIPIVCFLVISSFVVFNQIPKTNAKYSSKVTGNVQMSAAVAITELTPSENLHVKLDDMIPGMTKTYNFSVNNFLEDEVNETKMSYKIFIQKSLNMPIDISLYKNSISTNILDSNLESGENILSFGTNQTDNYELILTWDSSYNDESYAGLTDYLDILITSNQVLESD